MFKWGQFVGAGGSELDWKIECDGLAPSDWTCLANAAMARLSDFSGVAYVPTGGLRFAKAFEPYRIVGAKRWLIVDDVWTTGTSMLRHAEAMKLTDWLGCVAFARGPTPPNVVSVFKLNV